MKFSRQDFKKNAEVLTTILSSTWKIGKLGRCKSRQLRKSMPTFCPKELTRRLLLLHVTSSLRTSSLGDVSRVIESTSKNGGGATNPRSQLCISKHYVRIT
ncbi:hypothetical protein OUZ56_014910 [Daphnia magna]|uniref:Uncharacterized protein n=1 Tax=Daphnia magna TaxID=35525 RepID=A0ABR0AL84_9CRUS|nr:hypothetical protein OUZ56_014910 [Daphnia magna]